MVRALVDLRVNSPPSPGRGAQEASRFRGGPSVALAPHNPFSSLLYSTPERYSCKSRKMFGRPNTGHPRVEKKAANARKRRGAFSQPTSALVSWGAEGLPSSQPKPYIGTGERVAPPKIGYSKEWKSESISPTDLAIPPLSPIVNAHGAKRRNDTANPTPKATELNRDKATTTTAGALKLVKMVEWQNR